MHPIFPEMTGPHTESFEQVPGLEAISFRRGLMSLGFKVAIGLRVEGLLVLGMQDLRWELGLRDVQFRVWLLL